ncbi:N-terminal asparagine amidohydrolase protein [Nymphaea thermarum]|nr:N-terminal asparagine amidohydrolase protein [Nymphaea thermarum]
MHATFWFIYLFRAFHIVSFLLSSFVLFQVETSTGFIKPASFDRSSRIPDEIVRRLRVSFSFDDPAWNGKLLETYDAREDKFSIASCCWDVNWKYHARKVLRLSDLEVLQFCSTSPDAESPEFVENTRRVCRYLIKNPDWRKIFPLGKPHVFKRTDTGEWARCE